MWLQRYQVANIGSVMNLTADPGIALGEHDQHKHDGGSVRNMGIAKSAKERGNPHNVRPSSIYSLSESREHEALTAGLER
jgi:hypothetical protein